MRSSIKNHLNHEFINSSSWLTNQVAASGRTGDDERADVVPADAEVHLAVRPGSVVPPLCPPARSGSDHKTVKNDFKKLEVKISTGNYIEQCNKNKYTHSTSR